MAISPCKLPQLHMGREALRFWNAAISHSGQVIELDSEGRSFAFRVVGAPARGRGSAFRISMNNGARLTLCIEAFPFHEFCGAELEYSDLDAISGPLREALDQGVLEIARQWLPDEINAAILSAHWNRDASKFLAEIGEEVNWIEIELLDESESAITCLIGIEPGALGGILSLGNIDGRRASRRGDYGLDLFYGPASVVLPFADFASLRPGDLLVLDAKSDRSVLYVTGDGLEFVFNETQEGWVCVKAGANTRIAYSGKGGKMELDDTEDGEGAGEEPSPRSSPLAIPIRLDFEIGRMTLPVSEVETWQPGTIVELEPLQESERIEVHIHANGAPVARGELLRVDERLAVRIEHMEGDAEIQGDIEGEIEED